MKRLFTAIALMLGALLFIITPAYATEFKQTPRPSWSPLNGRVYALAQSGDTLFMGGSFTTLRSPDNSYTVTRNGLAAISLSTGSLLSFAPAVSGEVRALKVVGGTLYVGGAGVTAFSVTTGTQLFKITTNDQVRTIAANNEGIVYFGGRFTVAGGQPKQHLAAIHTDGSFATFNATANGTVIALDILPNDNIAVGGQFKTLSGASRSFIGSVAPDGTATTWHPPIPCTDTQRPCYVDGLDHNNDTVFAAVQGPGGRVVAYNASSNSIRWSRSGDGDVQAIKVSGSIVYAGGHFNPNFFGAQRAGIVALSATGGSLNNNFRPRVTGNLGVWSILDTGSYLAIGGDFTNVQVNGTYTGERGFTLFPA